MPALGYAYNPTDFDPDTRPEPIPAGEYELMVLSTDVSPTSTGTGSYLKIEHEVAAGQYQGRKIFDQITLENQNAQAVEIGQRQLSALCHAVGWLDPLTDSDVLHGRTLQAKVGIDPERTDQKTGKTYGPRNKIVAYVLPGQAAGNGAAPQKSAAAPAKAAAPPAAKGKRPWER